MASPQDETPAASGQETTPADVSGPENVTPPSGLPAHILEGLGGVSLASVEFPLDNDQQPQEPKSKSRYRVLLWGIGVILVILFSILLVGLLGFLERNNILQIFSRALQSTTPSTTLVDAHRGVLLMLEKNGQISRVMVERDPKLSWLTVSQDDTTATGPSLASNGEVVAYVTQQHLLNPDKGPLVVTSLVTNTRTFITTDDIQKAGVKNNYTNLQICSWTPTAWDGSNQQVAFFGCGAEPTFSVTMVAKLTQTTLTLDELIVIPESKLDSEVERQLSWLNQTQLTVSTPATTTQQAATVETYDVP